jgi:hypothetical protein
MSPHRSKLVPFPSEAQATTVHLCLLSTPEAAPAGSPGLRVPSPVGLPEADGQLLLAALPLAALEAGLPVESQQPRHVARLRLLGPRQRHEPTQRQRRRSVPLRAGQEELQERRRRSEREATTALCARMHETSVREGQAEQKSHVWSCLC